MRIEEAILNVVRALTPEKQHEVLDFAASLQARAAKGESRKPLRGLWKDIGVSISDEEISEARREMWDATAVALDLPLVTKDRRIRAAKVETLW